MSIPVSEIKPSATYMAGAAWLDAHIDEVVAQYPNQWVGVYKDRVVAADAELGKAKDTIPETIPRADVMFQFVDDGTLIFSIDPV